MDKLSVSGKTRLADAPRYLPPHRKYGQGSKAPPSTPASSSVNGPSRTLANGLAEQPGCVAEEQVELMTTILAADAAPATTSEKATDPRRATAPHHKLRNTSTSPATAAAAQKTKISESWEDETTSDKETSETPTESITQADPAAQSEPTTTAPKPATKSTYIAPHLKYRSAAPSPASPNRPERSATPPSRTSTPSSDRSDRRPEKTNAVAHRLIAGALGVRVPRRTEEQRAYDKAMREQEKKKRDQEREAKKKAEEDAARAKAAIWDD